MYKKIVAVCGMLVLTASFMGNVSAQTNNTDTLLAQIQALLAQVQQLQSQISSLQGQQKEVVKELRATVKEFRSQLREGVTNEEVKLLQELLSTDSKIYPEGLVTGHFGPLTKKALIRFQLKHGIEGIGEVGPQTRRTLNAFLNKGQQKKMERMGAAVSPNLLKKFNVDATTTASTTPDGTVGRGQEKVQVCHVAGNSGKSHTLVIAAPALNAHLGHGDTVGSCEGDNGNGGGGTSPDITAPVISNVVASSTTASTTHIQWATNEVASSKVTYATTTPVASASSPISAMSSSPVLSHDIFLQNITASTTYYYFVVSADAAGNTATSTEQQFTTQ